MMNFQDLQSLAKRFVQTHHGVQPPPIMHPLREWVVGLTAFVVLILMTGVYSFVLYESYDIRGAVDEGVTAPVVPYRAAAVEEALEIYQAQIANHQAVIDQVPEVPQSPVSGVTETDQAADESTEDPLESVTEAAALPTGESGTSGAAEINDQNQNESLSDL